MMFDVSSGDVGTAYTPHRYPDSMRAAPPGAKPSSSEEALFPAPKGDSWPLRGLPAVRRALAGLLFLLILVAGTATSFASASATLSQAANGSFGSPVSPVTWQSGNLNQNGSHYFEGQSAPYRLVMTGLTPGPHVVVIEWDLVNSSRNAIDYVTSFRRIAEQVDPLSDLSGSFSAPTTAQIPEPVPS